MKRFLQLQLILIAAALVVLSPANVRARNEQAYDTVAAVEQDLFLFFEDEDLIITATKHPLTLKKAPAIATVFTGRDVRNMGARDITDVLKRVPGFGITKSRIGYEVLEVRGIRGTRNEKVKFLIDGHSMNDNYSGGYVWNFDNLSVANVKRIEVIRGPGSALYGSNAISGVINVVTKNGADIDGVILSVGAGTFDTQRYNLQVGKVLGELDFALMLDYLTTEGDELGVKKDMFGRSGHTDDFEDKLDGQLKLSYKGFTLNARVVEREKGPYVGTAYVLTDENRFDATQYFVDLSYKKDLLDNRLNVTARTYYDYGKWKYFWEIFPEGTVIPLPAPLPPIVYPDGAIGTPSLKERTLGAELMADYGITDKNLLTVGMLMENRKQFDVKTRSNFDLSAGACPALTPSPFPVEYDVTHLCNWNDNIDRDVWAFYLQDVWDVTDTVALTAGIRHDKYSDVGNSTNPRAAVVWEFKKGWDLKLLYATAFRAPSMLELYNRNNPVELGNRNLKPEEMETFEISVGNTYKGHTTTRVSAFRNTYSDRIAIVLVSGIGVYTNIGPARVWGIETEIKRRFLKNGSTIYANYTYQDTEDRDTGREIPDVARHRGNIGADVAVTKRVNANVNVLMMGQKPRAGGDARSDVAGYTVVDVNLIAKNFIDKGLEFALSGYNVFNEKYEDSAPVGTLVADFPRESAQYMLEARYKF